MYETRGIRITVGVLVALAALLAGCHSPTESKDLRACQQTYEFGNTGCFEVAGQVVGLRGQPLSGIVVVPQPLHMPGFFTSPYQKTDSTGSFRLRSARMIGSPPEDSTPDTLSVSVFASDLRTAGIGIPASIRDSVLTVVTVAPVGAIPETVQLRITLPVP